MALRHILAHHAQSSLAHHTWACSTMHGAPCNTAPQGHGVTSQGKGPRTPSVAPTEFSSKYQGPELSDPTWKHRLTTPPICRPAPDTVSAHMTHTHSRTSGGNSPLRDHPTTHSHALQRTDMPLKEWTQCQRPSSPCNVQDNNTVPRYASQSPDYHTVHTLITQHGHSPQSQVHTPTKHR